MDHQIVALGEVLFDCFDGKQILGGAPTNFAGHVQALGSSAAIVSAVGDDSLGKQATQELERRGINLSGLTTNTFPTGTVDVVLKNGQPSYTINRPAAWDAIEATDAARDLVSKAAVVCFGTLAQREPQSQSAITELLKLAPENALRILDVNLRKPVISDAIIRNSVQLANSIKLNDEEVPAVASALGIAADFDVFSRELQAAFGIKLLFITCGSAGATIYRGDEKCQVPAAPVEKIVSTVGAGDSFTAAAVLAWLQRKQLSEIGKEAVSLAAKTCGHQGGLPPLGSALD